MTKLIYIPNQFLRQTSLPVEPDEDVTSIIRDMIETMYDHQGVGLAAVQIGVLKRIVVSETSERKQLPVVYINPQIVYRSLKTERSSEGCLSIPSGKAEVERAENILVQYHSPDGEHHVRSLDGLAARCLQHEVDHLDGVLYIDYLSRLKRERIIKSATSSLDRSP